MHFWGFGYRRFGGGGSQNVLRRPKGHWRGDFPAAGPLFIFTEPSVKKTTKYEPNAFQRVVFVSARLPTTLKGDEMKPQIGGHFEGGINIIRPTQIPPKF